MTSLVGIQSQSILSFVISNFSDVSDTCGFRTNGAHEASAAQAIPKKNPFQRYVVAGCRLCALQYLEILLKPFFLLLFLFYISMGTSFTMHNLFCSMKIVFGKYLNLCKINGAENFFGSANGLAQSLYLKVLTFLKSRYIYNSEINIHSGYKTSRRRLVVVVDDVVDESQTSFESAKNSLLLLLFTLILIKLYTYVKVFFRECNVDFILKVACSEYIHTTFCL